MTAPLVMLGPGGDYQARYDVKGLNMVRTVGQPTRQDSDTESAGGFAGYSRLRKPQARQQPQGLPLDSAVRAADSFEHAAPAASAGLYTPAGRATDAQVRQALLASAGTLLSAQRATIDLMARQAADFRVLVDASPAGSLNRTTKGIGDESESHTQATAHSYPHPRSAPRTRLFADHAGAGRRARRQQGHRLRARRSADQEGSLGPQAQQGTLFGA